MSEAVHKVPEHFNARIGPRELADLNAAADADPDHFWLDQARRLDWSKPPTTAGDWSDVFQRIASRLASGRLPDNS